MEQPGVDFNEIFASVAPFVSVRLLISLAAHEGLAVHHMDLESAFLNGVLEEVYVSQTPGFIVTGQDNKALRLKKVKSLGFEPSAHEYAVYARGHGSVRLLIGVYVDDLVITRSDHDEITQVQKEMKKELLMSDLVLVSFYLGYTKAKMESPWIKETTLRASSTLLG